MTDIAVRADETASPPPAHPLDPATAAEYLAGRDIMAAAGLLTELVRFAYYGLQEPPKVLTELVRFAYYGLQEPPKDEVLASADTKAGPAVAGRHGPPG
jgi:hypothetical protein